jgi:hypothetical protein
MKNCFTVVAVFAMTFLAAGAQAATNFSGEWKLNLAKSDWGPIQQFAPEFMTRTIKHADPSLNISTHQKGAAGEVTSEVNYTTDGKPAENKGSKGAAKFDGDKLVIDSVRDAQGTEIKSHEVMSLSADGKTLTSTNHLATPQGEFDITNVFEKQ